MYRDIHAVVCCDQRYIDLLCHREDAGPADAMLSYTWAYQVRTVVSALNEWAKVFRSDAPASVCVWICALCLNQHRVQGTIVTPSELAQEFRTRVETIGMILPLLSPWNRPLYTTRLWCLFELFTAIRNRQTVKVEIILAEGEEQSMHDALVSTGFRAVDTALADINSFDAKASKAADKEAITKLITALPGGFRWGTQDPWGRCAPPNVSKRFVMCALILTWHAFVTCVAQNP